MAAACTPKNDKVTFKSASLMGPQSGHPTLVESSEEGKIIRVRPFNYEDRIDFDSKKPYKIEARGKTFEPPRHTVPACYYVSYKKRVYSNNRVRYPLKRVDWDPDGDRNTQNRGVSRYERISWDEATTYIARELLRINEKYGMSAVLSEADMHGEGKSVAPSHGCANRLLSLLGGYTTQMRNQDSWEGWCWGAKNVWGCEGVGEMTPAGNLWPDIAKNSDMLLLWGADPETTAAGFDGYIASRLSQWIHSLGIKFVYVDPALNFSGVYLADKWIPVLPNTDAALQLAIAYVWLTEDIYEKEYVESHAVGYREFFDYVLGKVDGEPKTPAWASEKCRVPEWTIKALARAWANNVTSITHGNGGPTIRGPFSSEPGRLEPILLGMQGLGKPGRHQAKWTEWSLFSKIYSMPYQGEITPDVPKRAECVRPYNSKQDFYANTRYMSNVQLTARVEKDNDPQFKADFEELLDLLKPLPNTPVQQIPKCLVHDAILNGHCEWWGLYSFCGNADQQWVRHQYPQPGASRIHAIWTDAPCMVTCWNDGFNFAKAVRSEEIEFIVAQHPWLENDCYFADIILPVQTKFEMDDICCDTVSGIFTSVFREHPACPPVGESLNDFDAVDMVCRKLDELVGGDDFHMAYTGNEKSIERVIELFWRGSGVEHLDTEDEFHKKDIFVIPCLENVQELPAGLAEFCEDPDNHPLTTPTGKLEFTSTNLLKYFPDDEERPPYPKWIEKSELHDERFGGERSKNYPLLCMSNHGRWRFHANCDDITWNREAPTMKVRAKDGYQYEPAWINPKTAEKRGIKHGDIVKVYNERGTVLCGAYVTERLIEDVVYVDHGSRFDPIDPEKLDRGGAINLITPHAIISKNCTGMVVSGFLVECAKVTDEEMDCWKKQYPDAFARKIDEACGVCLDGWMIK